MDDLGSHLGTRVNGEAISGTRALRPGDEISVGPVVLSFQPLPQPAGVPIDRAPTAPSPAAGSSPTPLEEPLAPVLPPLPPSLIARLETPDEQALLATPRELPALPRAAERASGPKSRPPSPPIAEGPTVLTSPRPSGPKPRPSGPKVRPEAARPSGPKPRPAEPQPRQDEAQTDPRSPVTRARRLGPLVAAIAAVAAAMIAGVAVALIAGGGSGEPTALGKAPLADSFGAAPDVTWRTPGGKAFRYAVRPGAMVAVLHFQAAIAEGAVEVWLDGGLLERIPAEGSSRSELEVVLPRRSLRAGATAQIQFRPAPGSGGWRVSEVWVEELALPEGGDGALLAEAARYAARGREYLDGVSSAPDAMFNAWKAYRYAWLTLEPLSSPPPLLAEVRAKYQAIGRTLDERCAAMLQAAQRSVARQDVRAAKEDLDAVERYFPSAEHRCHNLGREMAKQSGL